MSLAGHPEKYSIHRGRVVSVKPYGAFVEISTSHTKEPLQGLVHVSQLSQYRVEDAGEVVDKGDMVYVKVISDPKSGDSKLSFALKSCNQRTGEDLDPNNVQLSLDEKKQKGVPKETPRMDLESILASTACKKCGLKGHMSRECFGSRGGEGGVKRVYGYVGSSEEEEDADSASDSGEEGRAKDRDRDERKKKKDEKKKKKKKKSKKDGEKKESKKKKHKK
eukprot:Nk52_evm15s163 gene=Nk52_evmTU15s163